MPPAVSASAQRGLTDVSLLADDDVWAVGSRESSTSSESTWVRHWNGSTWATIPTPDPGAYRNGLLGVSALSDQDVWAVGWSQQTSDDPQHQLILHWDGTAWSIVDPPQVSGELVAVDALSTDDVWISNWFGAIEHWDGSDWQVIQAADPPVDPPWEVTEVLFYGMTATSIHDVWAVGMFDAQTASGGYDRQPLIEHWNGKTWSIPTLRHEESFSYLFDVARVAPGQMWAVGTVDKGYEADTLTEHLHGHTWSAETTSYGYFNHYELWGVAGTSARDVWGVGYWRHNGALHTVTQHWDGSAWTVVPAAEPASHHNIFAGLAVLGPADAWAVGSQRSHDKQRALVNEWDGTAWDRR